VYALDVTLLGALAETPRNWRFEALACLLSIAVPSSRTSELSSWQLVWIFITGAARAARPR